MSSDQKFAFDSFQDVSGVTSFLQSLVDGFSKGTIVLQTEREEIILHPDTLVRFSVKAKKKEGMKNQLGIKIAWKEPRIEQKPIEETIKVNSYPSAAMSGRNG